MVIDITALQKGELRKRDVSYEMIIDLSAVEKLPVSLYGVAFTSPAKIKGVITDTGGLVLITLSVQIDYRGECARCLREVDGTLTFDYNRTAAEKGSLEEDEDEAEANGYVFSVNGKLNLDADITESVFTEFPSRLLCSADCAGICPACGNRLSDGPCGCKAKIRDPRWDALKNLKFDE